MALKITRNIDQNDLLFLWQIDESLEELENQFFKFYHGKKSALDYQALKLENRKKQWLSTRLIIAAMDERSPDIHYDQYGAPWIDIDGWQISISHSDKYAAVLASRYRSIGIDIQFFNGKIERIAQKFLHPSEMAQWLENKDMDYLHAIWTVKESVYKSFKCDQPFKQIEVVSAWPFRSDWLEVNMVRKNRNYSFIVHHEKMGELYTSYVRL